MKAAPATLALARACLVGAAIMVASCGRGSVEPGQLPGSAYLRALPDGTPNATLSFGVGPSKIKHVVIVVQENRSFDNIFGGLDANGNPFPGADTVSNPLPGEPTPHNHKGRPVKMQRGKLEACYGPAHDHPQAIGEIDHGKMDGFDLEFVDRLACAKRSPGPDYVYRFIEYSEVKPYWDIGEQYAISDRMFESITSSSFAAHLYLVAAQSGGAIDIPTNTPWGCDAPKGTTVGIFDFQTGGVFQGPFPCFTFPTLADLADQRGVPWRYYAAAVGDYGYLWSVLDAFSSIREGSDWTNDVVTPPAQFLNDVQNGKLASLTWVTPTEKTSDHPVSMSNLGPAWVASVVNAVGTSSFWDSTAVLITWDDWGGWYDHVPPHAREKFRFSLGLRVPLIVVSPYAKRAYVSHFEHSFGSLAHFSEEVLDMPSLGVEDALDDDLMDMFNFSQSPRKFSPIVVGQPPSAVRAGASVRNGPPPDDD